MHAHTQGLFYVPKMTNAKPCCVCRAPYVKHYSYWLSELDDESKHEYRSAFPRRDHISADRRVCSKCKRMLGAVTASRDKTEKLVQQLRERGGLESHEDEIQPNFSLCVAGGRTYAVDTKYRSLVEALCRDDTNNIARQYMLLPNVQDIGDPLLVSLSHRLAPEFTRVLATSMLRWTPNKKPEACNDMIQHIGATLLDVLADLRAAAPTYVRVVELISDRRFDLLATGPPSTAPTLLETFFSDSGLEDSDYEFNQEEDAPRYQDTDSNSDVDSQDEEQCERRKARSELNRASLQQEVEDEKRKEEEEYVAANAKIRDATSAGVVRKQRRLAYAAGLLLFQYEPCLSFVAGHAGIQHILGGANETIRTMFHYFGMATAVNTSNRHARLFRGNPMRQARLDREILSRFLYEKVHCVFSLYYYD